MGKQYFSDKDFVAGLNARTPEAYEQWYVKLYKVLFAASFRITKNSVESEDIVRGIFIDMYTIHRDVRFNSYPAAAYYFYVAVRNRSVDYWKSRRKFSTFDEDGHTSDEGVAELLSVKYGEMLWNLRYEQLEGILERLDFQYVEVLKLKYFKQKKTHEIAEIMGIAPQTVLNLKILGLKRIGKLLRNAPISTGTFLLLLLLCIL